MVRCLCASSKGSARIKKNAFKNPVIGALMLGNTKTNTMESHAHCQTVSVVSASTCVVLVLATGAGSLDIDGKLGNNELHEVTKRRISKTLTMTHLHISHYVESGAIQKVAEIWILSPPSPTGSIESGSMRGMMRHWCFSRIAPISIEHSCARAWASLRSVLLASVSSVTSSCLSLGMVG